MLSNVDSGYAVSIQSSHRYRYERGTLKADRFVVYHDEIFVVFSGGGNVEYGLGSYDCLDSIRSLY